MGTSCTFKGKNKEEASGHKKSNLKDLEDPSPSNPPNPIPTDNHYLNRLTEGQIIMLEEKFKEHQINESGLDLIAFKKLMPYISRLPSAVTENAFNEFANPISKRISWVEFCKAVSKYILGTNEEKCRFLYTIFENKKDKTLKRSEANQLNVHLVSASTSFDKSSTDVLSLFIKHDKLNYDDFKQWAFQNIDLHKALKPFEVIPSAATEKEYFKEEMNKLKKNGFELGESYFLISCIWMETWKNFVNFDYDPEAKPQRVSYMIGKRPVAIQNQSLLDPGIQDKLKPGVKENEDYIVLPKIIWKDLLKWYSGGPEIKRQTVLKNGRIVLEVFLAHFSVYRSTKIDRDKPVNVLVSVNDKVSQIIKKAIGVDKGQLEFLLKIGNDFEPIDKSVEISSLPLSELNICCIRALKHSQSEDISISFRNDEVLDYAKGDLVEFHYKGDWMLGSINEISNRELIVKMNWSKQLFKVSPKDLRKPKMTLVRDRLVNSAVGLVNLGNTCFLNSIIQTLFHTPLFKDFFSSENFLKKLKPSPYIDLIKRLFELKLSYSTTDKRKIKPIDFYKQLLKHTIEFQEGKENDCHELLVVIFRIIHEALALCEESINLTLRLEKLNEFEERLASKIQWKEYREERGSIISAIFGGQTRNVFTCQHCNEQRVIFELFNVFSVPIPDSNKVFLGYVTVVPKRTDKVEKISIMLTPEEPFESFLSQLEQKTSILSRNLIFAYNKEGMCLSLFQPLNFQDIFNETKKELFAFEIFTHISEVETLSQYTSPEIKSKAWRMDLNKNQLVDVLFHNEWVAGHVLKISEDQVDVIIHKEPPAKARFERNSESLQFFRTNVVLPKRLLNVIINHIKIGKGKNIPFGIPQVLTIGSWVTWKELYNELEALINIYYQTRGKDSFVRFFLYNLKKNGCGICQNSCNGCEIKKNYSLVSNLIDIESEILIRAFWNDSKCFRFKVPKPSSKLDEFSIHECFDKFLEKERIDLRCDNCTERDQISQIEVWKLPDILIIHLKRFCIQGGLLKKIDALVKFPLTGLSMSQLMLNGKKKGGLCMRDNENNYLYDLFAVINHSGTISSGHYTAYCLNEDEEWLFFDDEKVFVLNKDVRDEIVSNKAYILFYRRKRFRSSNVFLTRDILNSLNRI